MPAISRLFDFTAGTVIASDQVDAELNQLVNTVNALDSANLAGGAVTPAKTAITNAARALSNQTQTFVGDNAWHSLTFNQEDYDTNAMHDTATNNSRVVAPLAGIYIAVGGWNGTSSDPGGPAGQVLLTRLLVNGTTAASTMRWLTNTSGAFQHPHHVDVLKLAASDYVEIQAQHGSGGFDVTGNAKFLTLAYLGRIA